jgi:hypothetical protein
MTISFGKPILIYPLTREVNGAFPLADPLESYIQLHEQISHPDHNNKNVITIRG